MKIIKDETGVGSNVKNVSNYDISRWQKNVFIIKKNQAIYQNWAASCEPNTMIAVKTSMQFLP